MASEDFMLSGLFRMPWFNAASRFTLLDVGRGIEFFIRGSIPAQRQLSRCPSKPRGRLLIQQRGRTPDRSES